MDGDVTLTLTKSEAYALEIALNLAFEFVMNPAYDIDDVKMRSGNVAWKQQDLPGQYMGQRLLKSGLPPVMRKLKAATEPQL
ncbi:MAG: hypothetical protein QM705_11155 [Ancrocorticia sp.]